MKVIITILFLLVTYFSTAQSEQQFADIGDLTTTEGKVIKDCKVGFRTVGKLNAEKNNAILWPPHFTGTSEVGVGWLNTFIDTTGVYVIVVDALSNGVSSSPSNTPDFPSITIRDMVNSQYQLVKNHLKIDHLTAVVGISMGGMQTFEWSVAYPDFMDKIIPIIGTPKQSAYDLMCWQTSANILTKAIQEKGDLDFALTQASNIESLNYYTPAFIANNYNEDSFDAYLKEMRPKMNPYDYLGCVNAMISHDIYRSSKTNLDSIAELIKADILIIVATQDHVVNPISSSLLSEKLNVPIVNLTGDCGHLAVFCEAEKVNKAVTEFLKKN